MTAAPNFALLARMLSEHMLNSMLEGFAIAGFAWILLRVFGQRNSSTRFAVWFASLVAIAGLPFMGAAWGSSHGASERAISALAIPSAWATDLFVVWAAIATAGLARVGVGLWRVKSLRASCAPIDLAMLNPLLQTMVHEAHGFRTVVLCQSNSLRVPAAIGFFKPLVVIPAWALRELSQDELRSVVMHELAHLRRWDDWTNLAQQMVKALLFFHPAVWWIENKLSLEREMACDDAVLSATANPKGYAQCLVSIAEKSFVRRGLSLAQAAVSRACQTTLRVVQILDVNRSPATKVWKPALYSVTAFSVVCLLSLSRAPQLVAFEDAPAANALATATSPQVLPVKLNSVSKVVNATPIHAPVRKPAVALPSAMPTVARRFEPALNQERPIEARFDGPLPDNPVQALLSPTEPEPGHTLLVVMQSESYSQAGPMTWQVLVWRVTVFAPGNIPSGSRISAKKI